MGSHNPCSRDRKPPLDNVAVVGGRKLYRREQVRQEIVAQIGSNTTTAEIMSAKGLYADYSEPLRSSHTRSHPFDYCLA